MIVRKNALAAVALGAAAVGLGSCGKVGYLEQPAPLYGQKAKADYKARQAARAAAEAATHQGSPEPLPEALTPPEPGAATPTPAAPPPPQPPQ